MITSVSGPMFESSSGKYWVSAHHKDGGHYNTFSITDEALAMEALRHFFPNGEANEFNLVMFSTSGVHGAYTTIEEAEAVRLAGGEDPDDDGGERYFPSVTFLVVQPRLVTMRCGCCHPVTPGDFAFLKKLRASSWAIASKIGAP